MVTYMAGQKRGQFIQNHLKKYILYQEGYGEPPEDFKQRVTESNLLPGVIILATMWKVTWTRQTDQQEGCHINLGEKGTKGMDQGCGSGSQVKWAAMWAMRRGMDILELGQDGKVKGDAGLWGLEGNRKQHRVWGAWGKEMDERWWAVSHILDVRHLRYIQMEVFRSQCWTSGLQFHFPRY